MNIDELEQSLLRGARRDLGPSTADRERHQAELIARIDGSRNGDLQRSAGIGSDAKALRQPAASGVSWRIPVSSGWVRAKLVGVGLVVGVVIGGLVGFGLGANHWPPWSPDPTALTQASSVPSAPAERAEPAGVYALVGSERLRARLAAGTSGWDSAADARPAGEEPRASESTVSEAGSEAPSARGPAVSPMPSVAAAPANDDALGSERRGARARSKRAATEPATTPQSSLAIELAMLQRARRALNANNGRLALGLVHELDERFPKGVLVEERQATRILSLCMLDRATEARSFAARFLERYAGSVYVQRVRESCVADPAE